MKKLRFLLLDANVIIKLFELKLWEKIVERCEIVVAETVVAEAHFFDGGQGPESIDLSSDIAAKRVTLVSMTASEVKSFRDRFMPDYLERLDPGEAESLAYLLSSPDPCLLCSSDAIVFRILGLLHRNEQGISLEEVLDHIGLQQQMPNQYRRTFREHWTKLGLQDMVRRTDFEQQ